MEGSFLIYGVNGYTGRLILQECLSRNLKPIIAGRSEKEVKQLGESLGLEYRVFDLKDQLTIQRNIEDVKVVLHAAGPFIHTAKPMMLACIEVMTHYLDITGEIAVFEAASALNLSAEKMGIMVMPGVGFDVVPSDCLALFLAKQQFKPIKLELAFAWIGGSVSHGTALTAVENLGKQGAIRRNGEIVEVPVGHKRAMIPFPGKEMFAITIPWGDVSTAYYSTNIPNIEVYMAVPRKTVSYLDWSNKLGWLIGNSFFKKIMKASIKRRPPGPNESQRGAAKSLLWAQVTDVEGETKRAGMITPEGYTLTAITSVNAVERVLNGDYTAGFQTPARAYGEDFIMEVKGVDRALID